MSDYIILDDQDSTVAIVTEVKRELPQALITFVLCALVVIGVMAL